MSTSPYNPTVAKRWRDKNKAKMKRMQRRWHTAHPNYFKDYAKKKKKLQSKRKAPTLSPRQAALQNNEHTYHGRPCKFGHTEKYTQSSVCVQCVNARTKRNVEKAKLKRQQLQALRPISQDELEQREIDDYLKRNPEPTSFGPAYGRNSF